MDPNPSFNASPWCLDRGCWPAVHQCGYYQPGPHRDILLPETWQKITLLAHSNQDWKLTEWYWYKTGNPTCPICYPNVCACLLTYLSSFAMSALLQPFPFFLYAVKLDFDVVVLQDCQSWHLPAQIFRLSIFSTRLYHVQLRKTTVVKSSSELILVDLYTCSSYEVVTSLKDQTLNLDGVGNGPGSRIWMLMGGICSRVESNYFIYSCLNLSVQSDLQYRINALSNVFSKLFSKMRNVGCCCFKFVAVTCHHLGSYEWKTSNVSCPQQYCSAPENASQLYL